MKLNIRKQNNLLFLTIILISSLFPFLAISLAFAESSQESKTFEITTHARLVVEQAWETYHHAALGGTLASPIVQTKLEMNLHKSRALLAEAYDAEDQGDEKTVDELINKIIGITDKVITESRKPKK
jgi:hypothetical protein